MAGFFDEEDVVAPVKKPQPSKGFFDEQDIVQPVAPQPAQAASSFFDKADVVSAEPSAPEIQKPSGIDNMLTQEDINKVAARYGVSAEELRSLAPYYGAKVQPTGLGEGLEIGLKSAAGLVGRTAGLGIPQFAYKKFQDPKYRQALDELQDIADTQRTALETATELVAPAGLGGAATAAGRLAKAATMGGIIGTTGSREGQELSGAATGAVIGGGLGAAAEGLGYVLGKMGASKVEKELAAQPDIRREISAKTEEIAANTSKSESIIRNKGLTGEALTDAEAETLLREQKNPELFSQLKNQYDDTVEAIRLNPAEKATPSFAEFVQPQVNDVIESRAVEFAEDLLGKRPKSYEEALKEIKQYTSREGTQAVAQRYDEFLSTAQTTRAIKELGATALDTPGAFGNALNWLSDSQFVLRGLDRKYPTSLESTLSELNGAINRSSFPAIDFRQKVENIFRTAKKLGTDEGIVNTTKVYNALDTGNMAGLSAAEKQTAEMFKKYFTDVRDFVNKGVTKTDANVAPMAIPRRENYVPHQLLKIDKLVPAVESKVKEVESAIGKPLRTLTSAEYDVLKNSAQGKDLVKAVSMFSEVPITSGPELDKALNKMLYTRSGNIAMQTKASAAMQRNEVMPDFIKEKNLYILARNYADNVLKHAYLRKSVDKLNYQAKILDKLEATSEAEYVRNIARDLMGIRINTAAEATMQAKIALARNLDKIIERTDNPVAKASLQLIKAIPELGEQATRQIYDNTLGYFSLRAPLQNLTQTFTKTAPALGTRYGYTTVMRAAYQLNKNIRTELPRLLEKSKALGNVPAEFSRAGEAAIAEGVRRTALYRMPADSLAAAGKVGMVLFSKAEELNRALVTGIAEVMAKDIAAGSPVALRSLKRNFPPYIQEAVLRSPKDADKILAKHLNDTTMFNYNRASMSEFGRTMGPLFSAFSKWPTAQLGEAVEILRSKGAVRGGADIGARLLVPLALLQAVDATLGEQNVMNPEGPGLSDRQKKLLGSAGISQSAPAGALKGIAAGEIFTPPVLDAFMATLVKPVQTGEDVEGIINGMSRGAGKAAMTFLPGAGALRLIFDDLVTYVTGERPEGTSPVDRVVEGARRIK
jgi:hypothetical protein